MKSLAPYLLVFVSVIALAWGMASTDPITAAVVEARSATTAGPVVMEVVNDGLSALLKLLGGTALASALGFGFVEANRWYRRYVFEKNTGRFVARRPRGQGQPQPQPGGRSSMPRISRDDVMMALLGDRLNTRLQAPRVRQKQEANDEFNLDL